MSSKFAIFCFIYLFRIISEANDAPEKTVQIAQSELDDLNSKRDELIKLKQQQKSDLQTWQKDKKNLQEDLEFTKRKVWALLWFRWLVMIKNEIEWRETVVTNFTYNPQLFEEEKSKSKHWTERDEYHRQIWIHILENCAQDNQIALLVHEIDKTGIDYAEYSKNIALGYKELSNKLLSMTRWRNLPKFDKEPNFNTPITWSFQVDKCLLTLMFDVDKYVAWDFKIDLPIEQGTEKSPNQM